MPHLSRLMFFLSSDNKHPNKMVVCKIFSFAQHKEKYSRIPKSTDGRKPTNRGEQTETRAIFSLTILSR